MARTMFYNVGIRFVFFSLLSSSSSTRHHSFIHVSVRICEWVWVLCRDILCDLEECVVLAKRKPYLRTHIYTFVCVCVFGVAHPSKCRHTSKAIFLGNARRKAAGALGFIFPTSQVGTLVHKHTQKHIQQPLGYISPPPPSRRIRVGGTKHDGSSKQARVVL